MYECDNCDKETDGSYIDCSNYYCNPGCAIESAKRRINRY